jgi:hypothetical protein
MSNAPDQPPRSAGTTPSPPGSPDAETFKNPKSKASALFDLRTLIGALFTLYGTVLIVAGFFTSDQARTKANGININLWLGIGMLALGLFFLAWFRLRPLHVEGPSAGDQREDGAPPPGGH